MTMMFYILMLVISLGMILGGVLKCLSCGNTW